MTKAEKALDSSRQSTPLCKNPFRLTFMMTNLFVFKVKWTPRVTAFVNDDVAARTNEKWLIQSIFDKLFAQKYLFRPIIICHFLTMRIVRRFAARGTAFKPSWYRVRFPQEFFDRPLSYSGRGSLHPPLFTQLVNSAARSWLVLFCKRAGICLFLQERRIPMEWSKKI
jgi:hypothetical protein